MKFKALILALFVGSFVARGVEELDLTRVSRGETVKPIPVSMTGFSGEVDSVLRFDLFVMGFEFVSDGAQFNISGKNNGNVEGRVVDAKSQANLLAKAYSGGSPRSQAHALANDIVFAITGKKGIGNTKIAFRMEKNGGRNAEIYVADFDGHGATAITADNSLVAGPAWVPGQRRLVYASWMSGPTYTFVQDLTTGERHVWSRQPGNNYSPAVSPDGRKVAVIMTKTGNPELFVGNIDGTGLERLTNTPKEAESGPCWSPDGSRICYVSGHGGRPALFTVSANGGTPKRLNVGYVLSVTEPDWSPDGKFIIASQQAGATNFELILVPADGGEGKALVTGEDPSWAGNSRTVIFTQRKNNKRVLSILDVPTKRVKDVAQISGSCSQPSWSR